uniref:Carbonic anhydrase n=1 Tax=Emiliania huxleyi TaxID=2903 RepID=A0A7S3X359_EMIHU
MGCTQSKHDASEDASNGTMLQAVLGHLGQLDGDAKLDHTTMSIVYDIFKDMDKDSDGTVDKSEFEKFLSTHPAAKTLWEGEGKASMSRSLKDAIADERLSFYELVAAFAPEAPHHAGDASGIGGLESLISDAAWGYRGYNGPENWALLSPKNKLAATGKEQCPVDILPSTCVPCPAVDGDASLAYGVGPGTILNNGHTIQVNWKGGSMSVGGTTFEAAQFHFHTASETTIRGMQYPLEMHVVHVTPGEPMRIAVLAVLFETRTDVEEVFLSQFFDQLPSHVAHDQDDAETLTRPVDLSSISLDGGYYRLRGSLTTPPCTEGLEWSVLASPLPILPAQLETFRKALGKTVRNFRPTQPLNGRTITWVCACQA